VSVFFCCIGVGLNVPELQARMLLNTCLCYIGAGLNVPELQARMLFSTQSWSCDQHNLPMIHYLHTGADVIWSVLCSRQ